MLKPKITERQRHRVGSGMWLLYRLICNVSFSQSGKYSALFPHCISSAYNCALHIVAIKALKRIRWLRLHSTVQGSPYFAVLCSLHSLGYLIILGINFTILTYRFKFKLLCLVIKADSRQSLLAPATAPQLLTTYDSLNVSVPLQTFLPYKCFSSLVFLEN